MWKKLMIRARNPNHGTDDAEAQVPSESISKELRQLRRKIRRNREQAERNYIRLQALTHLQATLPLSSALPLNIPGSGAAKPTVLHELLTQVARHRPAHMVECGSGISTLVGGYTLKMLESSSSWIALEHDKRWHRTVTSWVNEHRLGDWVRVVYAPLIEHEVDGDHYEWYDLTRANLGDGIEFLLIDGPPANRQPNARHPVLPLLRDRLADGCLAIVDDFDRSGEKEMVKNWRAQGIVRDCSAPRYDRSYALVTFGFEAAAETGPSVGEG